MTYQETLDWMFAQLPMYQRQGAVAFKKDLSNTIALSNHLGNPETKFKSVHVAGTNGKGSSSHMIASILQEAGYKVGLYTSPHLKDFRERIKINGQMASESFVIDFIAKNKQFLSSQGLSFFEMTVGMAFEYFAQEEVDIAIVEVGLGGRLDSTNIISPEVCLITNIGLDHTQMLGETLGEIAFEKAGIIKRDIPVVVSETQEIPAQVFRQKALDVSTSIVFADDLNTKEYPTDLLGEYQFKNQKGVQLVVDQLNLLDWKIDEVHVQNGFQSVVKNTGLLGRWQILQKEPKIVCDTAHNIEGLGQTLAQLKKESYKEVHFVLGVVNDKSLEKVLPLFPKNASYYFCCPNIPRGLPVDELIKIANGYGLKGQSYASVDAAKKAALANADASDFIYIGGSTFVVAEVV